MTDPRKGSLKVGSLKVGLGKGFPRASQGLNWVILGFPLGYTWVILGLSSGYSWAKGKNAKHFPPRGRIFADCPVLAFKCP